MGRSQSYHVVLLAHISLKSDVARRPWRHEPGSGKKEEKKKRSPRTAASSLLAPLVSDERGVALDGSIIETAGFKQLNCEG